MSESVSIEQDAFGREVTSDRPAVGLVATAETADQIPAAILRARQRGHEAIVTAREADCEALAFAEALGATIIKPPESAAEKDDAKVRLTSVARAEGYPGLIYYPDPSQHIDFANSLESLRDADLFTVDAVPEAEVEQDQQVLVGIPAYNEADTIDSVVEEALAYVNEVLVVNDGSEDDTAERAEAAGAGVYTHDRNRGYGAALKTIFQQAERSGAQTLVIVDGDSQHDTSDIPRLVDRQRETDAAVVIGSRFGPDADTEMPLYRRFGLGIVNTLTNLSLGILRPSKWVGDTQSGFRAYDRRAIESIAADDTIGDKMSASTDILYHAHSAEYEVEEVPTTIDYSVEEASSHNPIQHGISLVMNIVRTVERERPITLLGLPGILYMFGGLGFGYWAVFNYIQTDVFPIGIALTASVLTIVGVLASLTAITLHSLALYKE